MRVEVAVIPAAGRGTRMRPATRAVPKALLPVVDRPAIQYAVEEASRAGVGEVILVVDIPTGEQVRQHFSVEGPLPGLEDMKVRLAVQEEPHGLGHAVLTASGKVGDRPFFCILPDDIVMPGDELLAAMAQSTNDSSVLCLHELTIEELDTKGVVELGDSLAENVVTVTGAVEKPGHQAAPSRWGILGRYLFTPDVFELLETQEPGHGGEVQLTDAINTLGQRGDLIGFTAGRPLLDVGNPEGLLEAVTVLGLAGEYGSRYRTFLEELAQTL